MAANLFDHDYRKPWPNPEEFPINEPTRDYKVHGIVSKDIEAASWFYIITGFTSLSNLVKFFGERDTENLAWVRIVFGFDLNERLSHRQPAYNLSTDIKNYWLKQNVSITLCAPILNLIEKIRAGKVDVRYINHLHAKIYVGDKTAMLGSSNFSGSGLGKLREANVRVLNERAGTEHEQYNAAKQLAENYWDLGINYSDGLIALLEKWLKEATWREALARALVEVLESKWMEDYPALYQAVMSKALWPSQKLGIGRAMNIIRDQGNLLLADPTGSGKTRMATALAYTIFHWMYENGLHERSNAFIVSPPQVIAEWKEEEVNFKLFNRVESTGKLSFSTEKDRVQLLKEMESASILIIDEAHNFLNPGTKRSKAVMPRCSTHVILATATPINKKPEDLLRLIELLDIDNLNDEDLTSYLELRQQVKKQRSPEHIARLKKYINQFIVRRTKRELNRMIGWDREAYVNKRGVLCRYPESLPRTYATNESTRDRAIARLINSLLSELKGVHYLQRFTFPDYIATLDDQKQYLKQRFNSAPALAGFEVKSALRSSACALHEYLFGSEAAMLKYEIKSSKSKSGNTLQKVRNCQKKLPALDFPVELLELGHQWIKNEAEYFKVCEAELSIYQKVGQLCGKLSDSRERAKARLLIELGKEYGKVLAFDSTVLTLDYLEKLILEEVSDLKVIVATGQSEAKKKEVRDAFSINNISSGERMIALCSDAMAESINLPGAQAMVLLDMPSVLRVIEQRIGRIERMDSEHKEVYVYWPDDAPEFSLAGDKRMIDILVMAEKLIGNNVNIPQSGTYKRYYTDSLTAAGMATAYKHYSEDEGDWEGVKDATQYLLNLIEGEQSLITRKEYEYFKEVDASVRTEISFIESDEEWSFFAFRGDTKRSAKWLLIDVDGRPITDFGAIAEKLVSYLKDKTVIQKKWREVDSAGQIKKIVQKLRKHEWELLPPKKKRALTVAKTLLEQFASKLSSHNVDAHIMLRNLTALFNPYSEEGQTIDYNHFAELWLNLLLPALDLKRSQRQRRKKIYTLRDLKSTDVKFKLVDLKAVYDNCQFSNAIDELVAACIIAVKK